MSSRILVVYQTSEGQTAKIAERIAETLRERGNNVDALNAKPSALFQVCLASANPDEQHTAAAHELVVDLTERTGLDPDAVGMFAGALVYTQYGWFKRHMMRAIVKHEGGDLDMSKDYEYTDWDAVIAFAEHVDAIVNTAPSR